MLIINELRGYAVALHLFILCNITFMSCENAIFAQL